MKTIGLTGNIATGKTTVLGMLRGLGAETLDADAVVHELYEPGSPVLRRVVERFGAELLTASGQLDRARLGSIVFRDPAQLKALEAIVHPAVQAKVADWWNSRRRQFEATGKPAVVVIDAVKLLESPSVRFCDEIWVVVAPVEQQLRRLVEDRGMPEDQARDRLRRQPDVAGRLARADVVIQNDGSLERTREQVRNAWVALVARNPDPAAERAGPTADDPSKFR